MVNGHGICFPHTDSSAAVLYSLTRTCALNDVDPVAYLTDVLGKIAAGWPDDRIAELLPHRWVEQSDQEPEPDAS